MYSQLLLKALSFLQSILSSKCWYNNQHTLFYVVNLRGIYALEVINYEKLGKKDMLFIRGKKLAFNWYRMI